MRLTKYYKIYKFLFKIYKHNNSLFFKKNEIQFLMQFCYGNSTKLIGIYIDWNLIHIQYEKSNINFKKLLRLEKVYQVPKEIFWNHKLNVRTNSLVNFMNSFNLNPLGVSKFVWTTRVPVFTSRGLKGTEKSVRFTRFESWRLELREFNCTW